MIMPRFSSQELADFPQTSTQCDLHREGQEYRGCSWNTFLARDRTSPRRADL